MLKNGRIVKDWHPRRIGGAIEPALPKTGEGMTLVQAALLHKEAPAPMEPIRVPLLATVERLAQFASRRPLGTVKPLKLFRK